MKLNYLDLHHGIGTTISGQDVFNHRFPAYHDMNFTYLNDEIDDFDLFHLINEEKESNRNHKKDFVSFILPAHASDHYDLFDTLNFNIEECEIMSLSTKNFKASEMDGDYIISLLTEEDFEAWMDLMFDGAEDSSIPFHKQKRDLYTLTFKQKGHDIYIAKDNDKIIGTLVMHRHKEFYELDDFFVLDEYQKKGIGSALQAFAFKDIDEVVLVSDANSPANEIYKRQGYKTITSFHICKLEF